MSRLKVSIIVACAGVIISDGTLLWLLYFDDQSIVPVASAIDHVLQYFHLARLINISDPFVGFCILILAITVCVYLSLFPDKEKI